MGTRGPARAETRETQTANTQQARLESELEVLIKESWRIWNKEWPLLAFFLGSLYGGVIAGYLGFESVQRVLRLVLDLYLFGRTLFSYSSVECSRCR